MDYYIILLRRICLLYFREKRRMPKNYTSSRDQIEEGKESLMRAKEESDRCKVPKRIGIKLEENFRKCVKA